MSEPAPAVRDTSWRRMGSGIALSTAGGIGFVLAFPPVGMWPLVFVAFVPIALAQHRVLPASWAGLAPMIGVSIYVSYLAWGGLQPHQRWWLLLLFPLSGGAGWVDARWQRATDYRHLWWSSPVLWTASLYAIGLTSVASWLDPAYALYREPWLIQPVSVLSLSGLNLVILLTNYMLAAALITPIRLTKIVLISGLAALLTGWSGGSAILLASGQDGRTVRVAAVQLGIPTNQAMTASTAVRSNALVLSRLESATQQAASQGAQLVVWPEKALQYFDPRIDDTQAIRDLVTSTGVYLVIGYTPDPSRLNQAAVVDPAGHILAVYNKQHPIGFAGDHSIGGPVSIANTPFGQIAPIICYDLDFEDTARDAARRGAQLLAVPSEDWPGIADQHYTHLVFRAVENRLAAVKADTAWDSAIIDPYGRIVDSRVSRSARSELLVATIPVGSGKSLFVTTGNWLGGTCLALSILWIAIGCRRGTRPS